MTFFKIKNKPFHFLFVFIFVCMTTKPVLASSVESFKPLSKEGKAVVLGDKDSLYLEKKKGIWRLIECTSFCKEVTKDDMEKITHLLKDLKNPHRELLPTGPTGKRGCVV